MKRNTTGVLIGLDVLLICLLAWLWINPHGGIRGTHWQPPAPIRPELGAMSAANIGREDADVSRFMAILDRPVFSAGRRPPPPPRVAGPDPLDAIHLYGMFNGAEGGGILARVDGKTRRVKVSEAIGEWTLKEIRSREIVFSRGAETRVVPLVTAKQTAIAAMPPPAIAAPAFPAAAPTAAAAPAAPPPSGAPAPGQPPAAASKPANPFVIGGSR